MIWTIVVIVLALIVVIVLLRLLFGVIQRHIAGFSFILSQPFSSDSTGSTIMSSK